MLLDVSASMAGKPLDALNLALPAVRKEVQYNPTVGEIARVAIITFSDTARTLVPLSDLAEVEIPELMVEGGTNFVAAFQETRRAIENGLASLPKGTPIYRPVVFFMSDGGHTSGGDWKGAVSQLRDPSWRFAPEVVTFGFGDQVDTDALRQIATRFSFLAKDADPAVQVREIVNALIGSIRTTSTSFRDPAQADGLHIEAPTEFFAPLPPMTL